mmetsp:Transcript_21866/g.19411  ORF Transcript_21866/g.19411 Transcript_21866/m.19411 type:complete len:112 (+) Transcript_21866:652-987(+)
MSQKSSTLRLSKISDQIKNNKSRLNDYDSHPFTETDNKDSPTRFPNKLLNMSQPQNSSNSLSNSFGGTRKLKPSFYTSAKKNANRKFNKLQNEELDRWNQIIELRGSNDDY